MIVGKLLSLYKRIRFQPGQWLLVRPDDEGLKFSLFERDGWRDINSGSLPSLSRFSRHILLLPDQHCLFRHRTFPLELLAAADLEEAVLLDMEQWVPCHESYDHLYFMRREDAFWSVSIWVWPQAVAQSYLHQLPRGLHCTHIMPAVAFSSISLQQDAPALLVQTGGERQSYVYVASGGLTQASAEVSSADEARRFCLAFIGRVPADRIFMVGEEAPYWPADRARRLPQSLPRADLLNQARCPGVVDWRDPLAWKKPIIVLLSALMLWMAGDAIVINLASYAVETELKHTTATATGVLKHRQDVAAMSSKLAQITALQQQQQRAENILAVASKVIPDDIWLNVIQVNRQWVDLTGQGKDVARLTVLLESLKGVKQVLLLGVIHPDARTGLETFQIRLMLTGLEPA